MNVASKSTKRNCTIGKITGIHRFYSTILKEENTHEEVF
jgi:hypothetical protein